MSPARRASAILPSCRSRCSISRRATSSARSVSFRVKALKNPGSFTRTTCWTCLTCASAPLTTAPWSSGNPARAQRPPKAQGYCLLMPLEADERAYRHAELPDFFRAAEVGQIDDEAGGQTIGADLLEKLHRGLGRAAGGDEVVDQDDTLAFDHRILMHF